MYVKTCANPGSLKEGFQVFDPSWGGQGPLSLASRPDLCVVHFGAEPVIDESRIMLIECNAVGGARGEGWEATDPCATPPVCNNRAIDRTAVVGNAITEAITVEGVPMVDSNTPNAAVKVEGDETNDRNAYDATLLADTTTSTTTEEEYSVLKEFDNVVVMQASVASQSGPIFVIWP